ncbi:MAG: hypothetical protein AAFR29_05450 [Pseudomonadota bacterium]
MTVSGRDALHQIDKAIRTTRTDVEGMARETTTLNQQLIDVRREEARLYGQIAAIRLKSLGAKETGVDALAGVDDQAQRLLAQHEDHLKDAQQTLATARDHLTALEDARLAQGNTLQTAITEHEEAAEATRLRLENDADYQAQATALEKANAIVDHAASKQQVAAKDRQNKGKPYENDPLFSYLWERKFATKAYRAFPLFAMLDRWVAGLIRYRDARLNYERLLDLPQRLDEHLAYVNEKASALADQIEAYERKALEADGVTALRDAVTREREALDNLDTEITQAEDAHEAAIAALSDMSAGTRGPMAEARNLLTNTLQSKSIPDLKLLAAETLTEEDDALVDQLGSIRLERYGVEDTIKAAERSRKARRGTLSELEKLRRRFKQMRFDSHQSQFHSAEMISLLLTDFARGTLGPTEVWRQLEKSHRVKRRDWQDDLGGDDWRGGFGLPQRRARTSYNPGRNWSRVGRQIGREIERELGRELGRTLGRSGGGSMGSGRGRRSSGPNWGGLSGTRRQTRRRPRSISLPRRGPRIRVPRGPRGGGGFSTGGGA